MSIEEIKQRLKLYQILEYYNLQPKNNMLLCPFHEDKRASLQVNLEKDFYKCHGCGKTGDVIQFVEEYEKCTKHQAILKCKALLGNMPKAISIKPKLYASDLQPTAFLTSMFVRFRKGIFNSIPAKEYAETRVLDYKNLEIGYNGGQFHHGVRKNEELIKNSLEVGLLSSLGKQGYKVFGKQGLVFPLKNCQGQICSLYFRSILDNGNAKHYYLKNRQGLYPNYPNPNTKKLILTESIIDAASLNQLVISNENLEVLACFGTNGLTSEVLNSIKDLENLEEIIFAFDTDKSGKEAVKKYSKQLKSQYSNLIISNLNLPNKDINETLQLHEASIFIKLLEERKEIGELEVSNEQLETNFSFSLEKESRTSASKKIIACGGSPLELLQQDNLLFTINKLLGKVGIVGEENNRLLMFVVASTYKMSYNLHVLYQGSSGSGKTHLMKQIAKMIPPEDVIELTRVTDSSLYNYQGGEFMKKLIVFEDMDGLKEDALLAVREMMSAGKLSSSTSIKDKRGNSKGAIKEVEVSFASLSATTKGELYEDNMSRIIVLSVDESKEQVQRIIRYKNQIHKGEINSEEQEKIKVFMQKCIRELQNYKVINPFADLVQLPDNVHKPTRMHEILMGVINQITILHQFSRQRVGNNTLLAEKQDIIQGIELMKDSILLKMDELEGKIRTFYENLKKIIEKRAKKENKKRNEIKFTRFDIKDTFLLSKTQINYYLNQLSQQEYLQKIGFQNKGFKYKIVHWDNFKKMSEDELHKMLARIKE